MLEDQNHTDYLLKMGKLALKEFENDDLVSNQ